MSPYSSLADRFVEKFSPTTLTKGQVYHAQNRVRIEDGDEYSVSATVRGTRKYEVEFFFDDKILSVDCTCPYFEANGIFCKHIWAVLLEADRQSHLKDVVNARVANIVADHHDGDDADDFLDHEYEIEEQARRSALEHPPASTPVWSQVLKTVKAAAQENGSKPASWPADREMLYILVADSASASTVATLEVAYRAKKQNGDWSRLQTVRFRAEQIAGMPDQEDRRILSALWGGEGSDYGWNTRFHNGMPSRMQLSPTMTDWLLPHLARLNRLYLRASSAAAELLPVAWDEGDAWKLTLSLTNAPEGETVVLRGDLTRSAERMPLAEPLFFLQSGFLFTRDRVARLDAGNSFEWIPTIRKHGDITVPESLREQFLLEFHQLPQRPMVEMPEKWRYEEVRAAPVLGIKLRKIARRRLQDEAPLIASVTFDYEGWITSPQIHFPSLVQQDRRRIIMRDVAVESDARTLLHKLGFRPLMEYWAKQDEDYELAPKKLAHAVMELTRLGWRVEAEDKLYRNPGVVRVEVTSGIDWFELHGSVDYDDVSAELPALLAAAKRGENFVKLGDGTLGILPEQWLKRYGVLAGLGAAEGDHVRFKRAQAGLLDALLASQPEARCDEIFARTREELSSFAGVKSEKEPKEFGTTLRGYQREALGWFSFLRRFGFGGCLADDMGLGKTVMALALLDARRGGGVSLVVAPRSLVFNWKDEAARFAPKLRILDHAHPFRAKEKLDVSECDLVITTYGVLQRDILIFKDVEFDYAILDEAQAVKNPDTANAKAVRLIQARHRLSLSGTPIENHLGELWSLFEFLNPGLLGSASVFKLLAPTAKKSGEDEAARESRSMLARALRPFILRRTKEEVVKDLPAKTEQTLTCELEPGQRKLYDELKNHYRASLANKIDKGGMNRAKIHILEALLRLRQAAIHPGLVDKARTHETSAKLDTLMEQLDEIRDEGHKALVFSQFTSFLAIVKRALDERGVSYEYLDGKTRDRAAVVERFQSDPAKQLFLLSLKAGGLGLNLTTADYVFILDPWWNPAVEAQAVDRTHRIGQKRPVFAYRIIAKDTVEEKILALQQSKRQLADAILDADESVIRTLTREDLELLLS